VTCGGWTHRQIDGFGIAESRFALLCYAGARQKSVQDNVVDDDIKDLALTYVAHLVDIFGFVYAVRVDVPQPGH